MPDAKTIAVYDAKASTYLKLTATSQPHPDLIRFMGRIPPNGLVLDLGCGPGSDSAHMRRAGLRPIAIDAAKGMVDLANDTYGIGATLGSFDDVTEVETYDAVWANFSLLHAEDGKLSTHISAIVTALKPGGVFHIAMKTGTGSSRDDLGRQYTYVSVGELKAMLITAGLTILTEHTGEGIGLSGRVDPFVTVLAEKHA